MNRMVNIPIDKVIQITSNDGGYLGGTCLACGKGGWYNPDNGQKSASNMLLHKSDCPMAQVPGQRVEGEAFPTPEGERAYPW